MAKRFDKQIAILDFIKNNVATKGYPPSIREICEGVGLKSSASVYMYLNSLEKYGYIKRDPSKPRAIEITGEDSFMLTNPTVPLPILKDVTNPDLMFENTNQEGFFPFLESAIPNGGNCFAYKLKGDSAIDEGVCDGDLLFVNKNINDLDLQLALAIIDGHACVGRVLNCDDGLHLSREGLDRQINSEAIIGKVFAVYRFS